MMVDLGKGTAKAIDAGERLLHRDGVNPNLKAAIKRYLRGRLRGSKQ